MTMSSRIKEVLGIPFSKRAKESIEMTRSMAKIEMLCNLLKRKDLVIFVGSGISAFSPSGLPTGNQLRDAILESLAKRASMLRTDIENIKKENPGLELLCQIIHDLVGDEFFDSLSFLNVDRPNSNHILLAKLAKLNLLRTIITTNFDCLIEKALMKEGELKQDSDFFVYYNENGFRRYLHEQKERSTSIIKLHGTIKDKKSIIASLRQIRGGLSEGQDEILENLFKKNHILFVGYSANDLDIYTKILGMADSAKGIYWNLRSKNDIPKGIRKLLSLYKKANPIVMDLRKLFGRIAQGLDLHYPYPKFPMEKSQQYFLESFDTWTSKMKICQPVLVLGFLSFYFFLYDTAIACFQQLLGLGAENKDNSLLGVVFNNLGIIYIDKKKFDKAIECFKRSSNIYKKLGNPHNLAASYNNLGETYWRKGERYKSYFQWKKAKAELEKAVECHKTALEIYKKIRDISGLLITYTNISVVYQTMIKPKKAWEFALKHLHVRESPEGTKLLDHAYTEYGRIPLKTYWYLMPNLGYPRAWWDEIIKFYKRATKSSKTSNMKSFDFSKGKLSSEEFLASDGKSYKDILGSILIPIASLCMVIAVTLFLGRLFHKIQPWFSIIQGLLALLFGLYCFWYAHRTSNILATSDRKAWSDYDFRFSIIAGIISIIVASVAFFVAVLKVSCPYWVSIVLFMIGFGLYCLGAYRFVIRHEF